MGFPEIILWLFLAFIVYLNILASVSIARTLTLSGTQKAGQLAFSWLIPILGAKFVLHLLSESDPDSVRWIPQRGHGWLIIGGTYHDSLHGQLQNAAVEHDAGVNDGDGAGNGGGD